MVYENKNGFYKPTHRYTTIICSLVAAIMLLGTILLGNSISSTRRYRAELERCAELEQTVREQEQAIRESSEQLRLQSTILRQTNTELGELIQSSEQRISEGLTTVKDLRKTMQFLENEYNDMRSRLIDINNDLSDSISYTEEK